MIKVIFIHAEIVERSSSTESLVGSNKAWYRIFYSIGSNEYGVIGAAR